MINPNSIFLIIFFTCIISCKTLFENQKKITATAKSNNNTIHLKQIDISSNMPRTMQTIHNRLCLQNIQYLQTHKNEKQDLRLIDSLNRIANSNCIANNNKSFLLKKFGNPFRQICNNNLLICDSNYYYYLNNDSILPNLNSQSLLSDFELIFHIKNDIIVSATYQKQKREINPK
jgi:hypothetical protein